MRDILLGLLIAAVTLATPPAARGQNPLRHWTDAIDTRFALDQPVIGYTIRVDSADLSGFDVSMTVRGARDTTLLAMVAHPEYDDKYWRFVRDARLEASPERSSVTHVDSALWRVIAPGGAFVLRYRLALPPGDRGDRAAWRPFLAPTGGLVGGAHSFMYVVGQTLAPSHVRLDVPASWAIATGLTPTSDPRTFFAPSVGVLVESPMLLGHLREWRFAVDGVPHRVVYWPRPDATPFDSVALISGVEQYVRRTVDLFGRAPYRDYVFLVQDGAYGALEHANSVTLGAPSRELAQNLDPFFGELGHEYFHTWNLMRIRPVEYGDVMYRTPPRSRGLWFSEGMSMFYADLLRRRAGLRPNTATRVAHLEGLLARYFGSPGNSHFSAERVSEAEYGSDAQALGDYFASTHLQGELIGSMLDLEIRHATGGRRSLDDVMRRLLQRFSGERGFTGRDVEHVVAEVCGCNVTPFFEAHVRGARPIPFDDYLRYMGLRAEVIWQPALGEDGRPAPDLRAFPYVAAGDTGVRIRLSDPASAWGRAGLHTGDRIRTVNGMPVVDVGSTMRAIRGLKSGDTLRVEAEHDGVRRTAVVVMTPVQRPIVRLRDLPTVTAVQREFRERWESGAP